MIIIQNTINMFMSLVIVLSPIPRSFLVPFHILRKVSSQAPSQIHRQRSIVGAMAAKCSIPGTSQLHPQGSIPGSIGPSDLYRLVIIQCSFLVPLIVPSHPTIELISSQVSSAEIYSRLIGL